LEENVSFEPEPVKIEKAKVFSSLITKGNIFTMSEISAYKLDETKKLILKNMVCKVPIPQVNFSTVDRVV
jgi:hypothetical protein